MISTLFLPPAISYKYDGYGDICPVKPYEHLIKHYDAL